MHERILQEGRTAAGRAKRPSGAYSTVIVFLHHHDPCDVGHAVGQRDVVGARREQFGPRGAGYGDRE